MTKKRFLAMLLTGAMTLSLAACGGTSTRVLMQAPIPVLIPAAIPTRSPSSAATRATHSQIAAIRGC